MPRPIIHKIANRLLPIGSVRREAAKRVLKRRRDRPIPAPSDITYNQWIKDKEQLTLAPVLKSGPKISIVVPCYNTPTEFIKELVDSVINQTYRGWQLCLADGSPKLERAADIETQASRDARIKYKKLTKNLGISANTNAAIKLATGEYIGFLDHDDVLAPWALNEVATAIKANPKAGLFYSDEDRLSEDGRDRLLPLFKPDWSPDLFFCVNYISHFLVAKKSIVDKLDGLRSEYDGSQDYDFALRALDHTKQIIHIPKILYHMRMASTSTAKEITIKDYAHMSGTKALEKYFKRHKIAAKVLDIPEQPSNHRVQYELSNKPKASIIIPFKDKADLLRQCVSSIIEKTTYKNYELILISNNSNEPATSGYLNSLKNDKKIRIFQYDQPFNYSALNNFGREQAAGDVLIFLNNDTEVINSEWLEELVSVALRPEIGAVGALLMYPNGKIQHTGVIVGMVDAAGHVFRNYAPGIYTPFMWPDWPRNYLAVTGACLAIETKKFDKVGGFEDKIIMAGSDVVLCLQLYDKGYLNVCWPYAKLKHHESQSVGSYQNAPPSDYDISIEYYRPYLNYHDPYFNPNLDLGSEQIKFRSSYD